ncbi:MAG: autotransporter-associated beta strand repeat-containing protein [bacterium]
MNVKVREFRTPRLVLRTVLTGLSFVFAGVNVGQAGVCTWTNGVAGNWNLASGWSNGVPTASDDVIKVGNNLTLTNGVSMNTFALRSANGNHNFILGIGGSLTVSNVTTGLIGPVDYADAVGGFLVQQTNVVSDVVRSTTVGSRGLSVYAGAASQTARLTITSGMTWNPQVGTDSTGPRVNIAGPVNQNGSLTLQGTITTSKGLNLGSSSAGTGSAEFVLDGGALVVNLIQRSSCGNVNTDTVNFEFRSGTIKNSSSAGLIISNNNTSTTFDLKLGNGGSRIFDATNGNISVCATTRLVDLTTGGGFVKSGTGTLTLWDSNTYSGTAIISNGIMQLANTNVASLSASSSLNVVNGAKFADAYELGRDLSFALLLGSGTLNAAATNSTFIVTSTLAPGDNGIGTLNVTTGCVQVAAGATYMCEVGGTTAAPTNDWVNLKGMNSAVSFGGAWTVKVKNVGTLNPTGKTFVLFDYTGANPVNLGTPILTFEGGEKWKGGQVIVDEVNTRVVLIGVVPVLRGTLISVF